MVLKTLSPAVHIIMYVLYTCKLPLLSVQLYRTSDMAVALIVLLLSSALVAVQALPTGAPAEACDSLSPSPSAHGAQPQSTASPYGIDLSPFIVEDQYLYTPGRTYTGKPSTQSTCTYIAVTHTVYSYMYVRFGPSQLSCLGSSVGRALCLEYRVSWVRVPPEAAHFF